MDLLDAVVAAPKFHRPILENASVRVLETVVEPGETVPVHTHQWPAVTVVFQGSELLRHDDSGNVLWDSREAGGGPEDGTAGWTPPLGPHTLTNVGERTLRVITVEIKHPKD